MINASELSLFVDMVGRTIVGVVDSERSDDVALVVKNPAIIHIQPLQKGQVSVQIIPYLIPEFKAASKRNEDTYWSFGRAGLITPDSIELEPSLIAQYNKLFSPLVLPSEPPVISLFDDKK